MSFADDLRKVGERFRPVSDVPVEAECKKHGKYIARQLEYLSGTKYMTECEKCAEEKLEKIMREEEEERRRSRERYEIEKRRKMGIEPIYEGATFDSFIAETDAQKKAVSIVRDLVAGKIKKIVMIGANGTGKTHLACAALREMGGKIMTMFEISATLRATYSGNGNELALLDDMAHYSLFVIDEIGRTKGSEAEMNWLSYIIDKRHVRNLPTILISNKHAQKTCDKGGCGDCLENYIGADIMSRLCENGVLVKLLGDDWRKKARQ